MKYIDLHCDTASLLLYEGGELYKNNYSIDIEKLKNGECLAQIFAMYISLNECENPYDEFNKMMDNFEGELSKNTNHIELVKNIEELEKANKNGKVGAFISIEEGEVLEGKVSRVKEVYDRGVRAITLTWNYENSIGYPNFDVKEYQKNPFGFKDRGLKEKGFEIVSEMERLGMLPDASHLSDRGFYDLIDFCKKPFIVTHSNSREITNVPRNMTDNMIKKLANKGGVMGINFCANFLGKESISSIDSMVKHIKHIRNVGGIDVLSLGSDFDGIENKVEIYDAGEMGKLYFRLKKEGFTEGDIEKIFYKNAFRLFKETLR